MAARRPWRSTDPEVIGWQEYGAQLPIVLRRMCAQVRVLPYAIPRLPGARSRPPPALARTPEAKEWIVDTRRALDRHGMDDVWRYHSLRTWQFASALADVEESVLDREALYVAALLHDIGMFVTPAEDESFAKAGARLAQEIAEGAGVGRDKADMVERAIDSHISMEPGNALGKYIQFGSLLDLTATGIWKLDRSLVDQIYLEWRRTGLPSELRKRWLAECKRLPHGRAAYARCPGALLLANRCAVSLPDRNT